MKQTFTSNIIFLVLINLLVKPFYVLVIDVEVQNTVGTDNYGLYFSIFNFCYLFQIIADLGIQNYNSQYIAKHKQESPSTLPKILGLKIILGLLFIAVSWLFFELTGFEISRIVFLFVLLNQLILSFVLYIRSNVASLGYYAWNSFLSVIDKIILIGLLIYLLWYDDLNFTILNLVQCQFFALTVALIITVSIHYKLAHFNFPRIDLSFSRSLIQKTWPYATIVVLMTAYTKIDAVMLERIISDNGYQAGVYAAGYRLLDASNMIAFLFGSLLLPMFANVIDNRLELQKLASQAIRMILVGVIPLVIYVQFYASEIVYQLYDEATDDFSLTLSILFPSLIGVSIGYIYGTLLTASERIRELNIYFVIGIVMNVILNLILIPKYQAIGAAWATLVTQSFVAIAQYYKASKIHLDQMFSSKILVGVIYTIACILLFKILNAYFGLNFIWALIVGMTMSLILAISMKILNIKELTKIFSNA